jgi:CBS domain-containing protein
MCVSPETDIGEAAKAMAARGVDILGVVADGELVGILCRDALLRTLFPPD